jgi:hypothetical protein
MHSQRSSTVDSTENTESEATSTSSTYTGSISKKIQKKIDRKQAKKDLHDAQLTSITLDCILDKEFQVLEALDKSGCKISELNMVVNQNNDFVDALKELCNHAKKKTHTDRCFKGQSVSPI